MMRKRKKKGTVYVFLLLWVLLGVFFGSAISAEMKKYYVYKDQEKALLTELAKEKARTEEYQKELKYFESDAYVEKVAREKLGLVKDGEIIFYNQSGK